MWRCKKANGTLVSLAQKKQLPKQLLLLDLGFES